MYIEEQIADLRKAVVKLEIQMSNSVFYNLSGGITNSTIEKKDCADCDIVYTVKEVSKILKTNTDYVYKLIKTGILPALKIGNYKVRKKALIEFLEKYEGKDLTDLNDIKGLIYSNSGKDLERNIKL